MGLPLTGGGMPGGSDSRSKSSKANGGGGRGFRGVCSRGAGVEIPGRPWSLAWERGFSVGTPTPAFPSLSVRVPAGWAAAPRAQQASSPHLHMPSLLRLGPFFWQQALGSPEPVGLDPRAGAAISPSSPRDIPAPGRPGRVQASSPASGEAWDPLAATPPCPCRRPRRHTLLVVQPELSLAGPGARLLALAEPRLLHM